MFIVSMKANKKKIFLVMVVVILAVIGVFFYVNRNTSLNVNEYRVASYIVENNQQRIDYLKTFGWIVSDEATEIVDVVIPEEFSDVYKTYNKIQKEQGFDLEKYKGKRVKRYTYEVKNYPNQPEYVRANMLVYNNQVIGGDICSIKIDGFMHGFALPRNNTNNIK